MFRFLVLLLSACFNVRDWKGESSFFAHDYSEKLKLWFSLFPCFSSYTNFLSRARIKVLFQSKVMSSFFASFIELIVELVIGIKEIFVLVLRTSNKNHFLLSQMINRCIQITYGSVRGWKTVCFERTFRMYVRCFFFKLTCFVCCRNFLRDTFFFFSSSAFCNYDITRVGHCKNNESTRLFLSSNYKQTRYQGLLRIYTKQPLSFSFPFAIFLSYLFSIYVII